MLRVGLRRFSRLCMPDPLYRARAALAQNPGLTRADADLFSSAPCNIIGHYGAWNGELR